MGKKILETERLILRHWQISDAEDLFRYASDPDVGPITGWPPHQSPDESRYVIENVLNGEEAYAICLKPDNKAIGAIELRLNGSADLANADDECELGFWLGKPFWGRGIMPEASRELLRHAFEDLGMNKVWCGYYDGNTKSMRAQEKIGFRYQGKKENVDVPLMNEKRNVNVSLITREDWLANIKDGVVTTEDLGRDGLKFLQHRDCYKLDTASVLLAWFAASFARAGKPCEMLELGSGTGGVSLLVSARCKNAHIDGVELMELPYNVFYENIKLNGLEERITAYNCDLCELPAEIKNKAYDVVFMNPPFYDGTRGSVTDTDIKPEHESKARFSEQGGLEDFIQVQSLRTRTSGGFAVMCICPERVPEVFRLYEKYKITPVRLLTVHANASKPSFLALIAGKKGSPNAEFKALPPLFINEEGSSALTKRAIHIYEEEHTDCFI